MLPAYSFRLWIGFCFGMYGVQASEYAVKEKHHVPNVWSRQGPAPSHHIIRLQIGLKQGDFGELERHLYEVSTPSHERYGQHLSATEVAELVKPKDTTRTQVCAWLRDHGITEDELEFSRGEDWIRVSLPVTSVERLLRTKYSIYRHEDGTHLIRTLEWSLPESLHTHIETIQPTNSFFRPMPKRATFLKVPPASVHISDPVLFSENVDPVTAACNATAVTPQCLRTLYGTSGYIPKSAGKNQIGLANYLREANNRSDVNIFLQKFQPEAANAGAAFNFTTKQIANGDDQQTPLNASQLAAGQDLEGNLDAETIIGITFPTPLTTYNTGGSPPFIPDTHTPTDTNEPYLDWVQFILSEDTIPQVISTSYGDDEQTISVSLATSICNSFAQLGARGVTLLFSSGDTGVGSTGNCTTNDGKNTSTFLPGFPGSCPYVTTVGATKGFNPEVAAFNAANNYSSGGGFSNYFARPPYQDDVVPAYINSLGDEFAGLYNTSGRGYPDISAQGFHYLTIWNGTIITLDGTSAATPTAASIISLLNDALIAAGKPVLGFLNPWLYSGGSKAFTDIVDGSAVGCGGSGFPAKSGWDAVTGFGTPSFSKLQEVTLGNGTSKSSAAIIRVVRPLKHVYLITLIVAAITQSIFEF